MPRWSGCSQCRIMYPGHHAKWVEFARAYLIWNSVNLYVSYWPDSQTVEGLKTAVLECKCIHGLAPVYLQELCVPVENCEKQRWCMTAVCVYGLADVQRSSGLVWIASIIEHYCRLPYATRMSLSTLTRKLKISFRIATKTDHYHSAPLALLCF